MEPNHFWVLRVHFYQSFTNHPFFHSETQSLLRTTNEALPLHSTHSHGDGGQRNQEPPQNHLEQSQKHLNHLPYTILKYKAAWESPMKLHHDLQEINSHAADLPGSQQGVLHKVRNHLPHLHRWPLQVEGFHQLEKPAPEFLAALCRLIILFALLLTLLLLLLSGSLACGPIRRLLGSSRCGPIRRASRELNRRPIRALGTCPLPQQLFNLIRAVQGGGA